MQTGRLLEYLRVAGVVAGIYFAIAYQADPGRAFSLLSVCVVGSIAGLTGIESLFFGRSAARASGYSDAGAYQRQSGLNNLALAAIALLAHALGWGTRAEAALCLVLLLFLTLSSVNHLYSALREGNRSVRSFSRPLATLALLGAVLPFLVRALTLSP
jgi:Family of unknown function (DUF6790)